MVGTVIEPMQGLERQPLYPHDADDYLFLIYQSGQLNHTRDVMKSTAVPILQWFAIIFLCSLVLYVLRISSSGRNTNVGYLMAFIDSVAIFLGNALRKVSNNQPEGCYIIAFSIFGLIFKTIFTGNLFVMYQQQTDHRIRTINQLNQLNITFYAYIYIFSTTAFLQFCKGKPV